MRSTNTPSPLPPSTQNNTTTEPSPGLVAEESFEALLSLVRGRRLVVLSGAGCSTESGIPDYRGPQSPYRQRKPIQFRHFLQSAQVRARFWARSMIGWERFAAAQPNDAHRALAQLEKAGLIEGIITQNVDRLHQAAGSQKVIELHGALERVRCLACGHLLSRFALQQQLLALNPTWATHKAPLAPDGDVDLPPQPSPAPADFQVPDCPRCQGLLKPDVVFFGENVPSPIVQEAWDLLDRAEVLLVVGSSLTVFSGYRFVRGAAQRQIPIAIINLGPTRGDEEASLLLDAPVGLLLPQVAQRLLHSSPATKT